MFYKHIFQRKKMLQMRILHWAMFNFLNGTKHLIFFIELYYEQHK